MVGIDCENTRNIMVQPEPVPSSNVLEGVKEDKGVSETNNTPVGLQPTKQKSKVSKIAARAMAALNDDGSSDSDSDEDNVSASALGNIKGASDVNETNNTPSSDTDNMPTIDFTNVFNELQKYKEDSCREFINDNI